MTPPPLKEISYSLEIDEEGYPIFSGLRIHDEAVLKDIFTNLQRSIPEDFRSKLVTCLESKNWAWIDAFDAPLVAQGVKALEGGRFELEFLGELRCEVSLEDLEIDEWHRFHAEVGPERVPAVLSRKAHAALLNFVASQHSEAPKFGSFRAPRDSKPSESTYWSEAYRAQQTGWELGEAHPILKSRSFSAFESGRILVPGAGRGHDAAFFAKKFSRASVTAIDFAGEAKREAMELYPSLENLDYLTEDVFAFLKAQPSASWDLVFEHTFFCAIDPLMRPAYVRELTRVLKPGGSWSGVFFLLEHRGGAPFALTQWELREFTREAFRIQAWEHISDSPKGRLHKELWVELIKN